MTSKTMPMPAALSSNFISAFLCLSVPSFFGLIHLCVPALPVFLRMDGWLKSQTDARGGTRRAVIAKIAGE